MRTAVRVFLEDLCNEAINDVQKSISLKLIASLLQKSKQSRLYSCDIIFKDVKVYDYYNFNVKLYDYQIMKLCLNTEKQSGSHEWFFMRKYRISASQKAHSIKTNKKKTVKP